MHNGACVTRACALALGCALLASGVARAAPLDDARKSIDRLEYDQALVSLEAARRGAGGDPHLLAESWLCEGIVEIALDRPERALAAFRRARRLDPAVRPAPSVSPKVQRVFDQAAALEAARARDRAQVAVRLDPFVAPEVAARAVEIAAQVTAPFDGLQVRLAFRDEPAGLAATLPMVRRDGDRFAAQIPPQFVRKGASPTVRAELYSEGEVIASDPPAAAAARTIDLPRAEAALQITSPIRGAELSIDGVSVGRAPLASPAPVAPGRRAVRLRAPGIDLREIVQARPGEVTQVVLALGPQRGVARLSIARSTLLGVGAALVAAGIGLAIGAATEASQLESASASHGLPATDYATVRGLDESRRAFAICSDVAFAVGAAAAATGALLFLIARPRAERLAAATDLRVRF